EQRRRARSRWKATVDPTRESRKVEQHVDRHDEDDDRAEDQLPERDRRALGKAHDLVRVVPDVVLANVVSEPWPFFLTWIPPKRCVSNQCCSWSTSRSAATCPVRPFTFVK